METIPDPSAHLADSPLVLPLDIGFKGGRDYLHGTDIYNALCAIVLPRLGGPLAAHQLMLHKLARTSAQGLFFRHPTPPQRRPEATADFAFLRPSGDYLCGHLLETGQPVTQHRPYDEDAIAELSHWQQGSIAYRGASPYSPIEVVVALTKRMHLTSYPEAVGKWVFSKLELPGALPELSATHLEIHLRHNFNFRLTKSEIVVSDKHVGWIYFSLIKP